MARSTGSSPRVRGTVVETDNGPDNIRFIPACAGNRTTTARRCRFKPVHPRVCGEQSKMTFILSSANGSSPRVRGTVCAGVRIPAVSRFIPACAGNRTLTAPGRHDPTVHPRVCGEQVTESHINGGKIGSSPRVRGTDPDESRSRARRRFIPACAGNRTLTAPGRHDPTVHPRVCGEQVTESHINGGKIGSSPRVRGTDPDESRSRARRRFIPACAGNSPRLPP